MRHRQERFLSLIEPNAESASVTEVDLAELPSEATGELRTPLTHVPADIGFTKPDELTWWDWTVFLLHTAAEIEHALMVQYLYAGWSLPPDGADLVRRWRREVLQVAREEMAHFVAVQNLLRFVGGPLNFDREDFPYRTE